MASRVGNIALMFLPVGLVALSEVLADRDENDTGTDDDIAEVIAELSLASPDLIRGKINDKTADKVFLGLFRISESYLRRRGKLLPGERDAESMIRP